MFRAYRLSGPGVLLILLGFLLVLAIAAVILLPLVLAFALVALAAMLLAWLYSLLRRLFRKKPRPRGIWAT